MSDNEPDRATSAVQHDSESDLVLHIASTSAVAKTQASTYTTAMTALERLSSTTVRFGVEIPKGADLAFLPGQYVNIAVPGDRRDPLLLLHQHPRTRDTEFLVKLTPGGSMSTYLTSAPPSATRSRLPDPTDLLPPRGRPPSSVACRRDRSRPDSVDTAQPARRAAAGRLHLIYGVSTDEDAGRARRDRAARRELSGLTWDFCVADPNRPRRTRAT